MVNPGSIVGGIGGIVGAILANKEAKEKEKKAASFDKKVQNSLNKLEEYEISDLYKAYEFGDKPNNLQKFKKGELLQTSKLDNTSYESLANDKQLSTVGKENIAFLKNRRDSGLGAAEAFAMKSLLNTQRNAARNAQKTITDRAIERGADPLRVNLTDRLLSTQANAETGSQNALQIANNFENSKLNAAMQLDGSLASEFRRQSEIASARDRFKQADVNAENKSLQQNWQRSNEVSDNNTSLVNDTSARNIDALLNANKMVIDSKNEKNEKIANYYSNQSSALRGEAERKNNIVSNNANNAINSFSRMFS